MKISCIDDLKWLGLDWDEGPGPRRTVCALSPVRHAWTTYREHAERLVDRGQGLSLLLLAEEELEKEREQAHGRASPANLFRKMPRYSIRRKPVAPRPRESPAPSGCSIPERPIRFHDIVHGDVEFSNEVVSDPIILRSSGMPVYNYVVVIDDALMKITHVIRGDDHLSNTPKQVALYEALGWPVPEFAHLSTILGSDRERLSKRHGATSIANFRDMGVLPEALVNYLALLGWAPTGGTRELFSPAELKKEFSLERVTPSAAMFDMEKLYWLNRHYIKSWPVGNLVALSAWFLAQAGYIELKDAKWLSSESIPIIHLEDALQAWLTRVTELLVPSVDRLDQLPARASLIFNYDAKAALAAPDNAEVLAWPNTDAVFARFAVKILEDESAKAGNLTSGGFKLLVNQVKAETGVKGKELFHPIRIVITGSHSGPEFDKLVPILEAGSRLTLPKPVLNVRQRVEEFARQRAHEN